MLSVAARVVLFVSAYAPLLALFAILESFGSGWPSWICAIVAVTSAVAMVFVWALVGRSAGDWQQLASAHNRDSNVMAFFVSYVVPFAVAQHSDTRTRIALALFAIIIAGLYVRSAIFYVHPLLLLAGYHIFEAMTETGVPIIVIARQRYLHQHQTLWASTVAPAVYLETKRP
jgi:hypothetical protein